MDKFSLKELLEFVIKKRYGDSFFKEELSYFIDSCYNLYPIVDIRKEECCKVFRDDVDLLDDIYNKAEFSIDDLLLLRVLKCTLNANIIKDEIVKPTEVKSWPSIYVIVDEIEKECSYLYHLYYQFYNKNNNSLNNIETFINDYPKRNLAYTLTIILLFYLFAEESIEQLYKLLSIYFGRLDCIAKNDDTIVPDEMAQAISKLPTSTYKALFYYMWKSGITSYGEYYNMFSAITDKNPAQFSNSIRENDKARVFISKYYSLIKLAGIFISDLSNTPQHGNYRIAIKQIEDYYETLNSDNILPRRVLEKTLVLLCGIHNEVLRSHIYIHEDCNKIISETLKNESFKSTYENALKKYQVWQTYYTKQTKHVVEIETKTEIPEIQIQRSAASSMSDNIQELNLNPEVSVNQLDEFIKYLAWRNYISEDDIESFKYIVFGGQCPSNFNKELKFSTPEGAKPLLANILWWLKKDAPNQIIFIFGENVTQSNLSIGTKSASQRVFVDLCLFFPFLINKLKLRNNKNVEEMKNKLSTCVIELLHENKGNPYSLRNIQSLQKSKGEYWTVK